MAPSTASLKPRRAAAASKQPVKPVVPALPLPCVKRQAAPSAAASTRSPPAHGHQPVPGAAREQTKVPISHSPHDTRARWDNGNQSTYLDRAHPDANGHESSPADKSDTASFELGQAPTSAVENAGPQMHAQSHAVEVSIQQSHPAASFETSNGAPVKDMPNLKSDGHYSAMAPESHAPSSVSPTHYHVPPPFQPTNRPLGIMANGEMGRLHPQNGPHHVHQTHPRNGCIHFGNFHDSQSSSPAPPRSGGIAPPPGIAGPDGRPGYMGHNANGFPPMVPYGGDMVQVANFDNYGRPAMAYGPMDSYPPYGSNYGPSTPHSFHDSQSPVHPEDNGMYGPYQPGASRNGGAVPGDDVHPQNQQRRMFAPPDYPRMPPNLGPPPMMPLGDHGDGVIGYLQQQFASPELADCTLELRYPNDRAPPARIPGHRLVFARSLELAARLQKKASEPESAGGAPPTIVVGSDSPWVRSDAFYMAVQRLYGLPLLQMPPHNRTDSGDLVEAGSAKEQFEFSLSYAAAGCLLDWAPVTRRGCEVATQLLGWQTMEKGLEFALDNYSDKGTHGSYKYGDGSRAILHAVAAYIVHNLPPSFNLDTSAEEPKDYARLPVHAPPAHPEAGSRSSSPAIARGSSVQLGKGRRSQQIANIQFGDFALSEARNGAESETPKATQQAQPVSHAILSRVLLNLPFTHLKMILEMSGSGNLNGWASAEARHRVIKRAVEEREARRLRTMEAVVDGRVSVSDGVWTALRSQNPQDVGRWTSLGWQEKMLPCLSPGGASLVRRWIPPMEPQNGSAAAYP